MSGRPLDPPAGWDCLGESSGEGSTAALSTVDLRVLGYFVAVAEELHFGRAARRLQIAQPALSRAIRSLEAHLKAPLLRRDSRNVALTDAGRLVLAGARELISRHAAMLSELSALQREQEMRLRVAFTATDAGLLLARLLRACSARLPGVSFECNRTGRADALEALERGAADIALCGGPPPPHAGTESLVLTVEPCVLVLAADHPAAHVETIESDALHGERLLGCQEAEEPIERLLAAVGMSTSAAVSRYTDVEEALELAAAGQGVMIGPRCLSERYPRADLRFIPITDLPPYQVICAWRSEIVPGAASTFVKIARKHALQLAPRAGTAGMLSGPQPRARFDAPAE